MIAVDKNIPAKVVIDPTDEPLFHTPKYKKLTELRFLPSLEDFPAMIFIYGNKVAMFTVRGDLIGVIIENKQFSEAMKIVFDMYWSQAKSAKL